MEVKNIFQIWDEGGRKTPFVVRKVSWAIHNCVVVERIECEIMPYGKAFGYSTSYGKPNFWFRDNSKWRFNKLIPQCCLYQWVAVDKVIIF